MVSRLKLCQPSSVLPSNRSFHPAAFSASVRVLCGAASAAVRGSMPLAINASASKRVCFMRRKLSEEAPDDNENGISSSPWAYLRFLQSRSDLMTVAVGLQPTEDGSIGLASRSDA